jgi:outer membrane protein insertion porin family
MFLLHTMGPLRTGIVLVILTGAATAFPPGLLSQIPDPPTPEAVQAGGVVDSIAVEGNRWVDANLIVGTTGLQTGTPITFVDIQEAERRLWATGRFRDIQVYARGGTTEDDPVILTLRVEEYPLVRRYRFEGLENLSERDIRDEVELRVGEPYSPQRIVRAKDFIRRELAAKGIPFAQIEERQVPVSADEGEVEVILDISEGHRVTVARVEFEGNEAFSGSELRSVLSTRAEGFWWFRTGEYREEALQEDLAERLPDFYASHGYLDFQILGDTIVIDPATGKSRLEIMVDEGPQYRVARFEVAGNRQFPSEDLERYYQREQGGLLRSLGIGRDRIEGAPVFDRSAFYEATDQVSQLYRNQGYLYAQVEPIIERLPPQEGADYPRVALRWQVEERQPAYIRRINIEGNTFTHDRIIRERIALLPGDIYSEERVLRSYQAISGLGFFETPLPFPDIQPDPETGDVDITFRVEEQQTGSINFGTSMGGYQGVAGFLGYDQPNLFGQAKSGSLRWDFGRFQNNFQLQYTDPSLRQSRISGSVSLFRARDRFFTFASGEQVRTGGLLRFGVPIPGSMYSRLFMGYTLSQTDFRLRTGAEDTSLFGRPAGTRSTVVLGLTRATRDHPIFPTVGSNLSWDVEVSGGILGGDGDFTKHRIEGEWWVPVGRIGGNQPGSRPVIFTLGLHARGGTIFGDATNFPFDRFWLGGVQFGESLRGYDETTITPRGHFPRGSARIRDIDRLGDTFMKVGAEYAVRLNDNISLSTFYEAGNVWLSPREMDPSQLFRGAGVGVQLVTPFGPIGLDYAYGFDKDVPGWQLHFRMGGQGPF